MTAGATPADIELELSLRGSLLVQQQRRIVQLEEELQSTWGEVCAFASMLWPRTLTPSGTPLSRPGGQRGPQVGRLRERLRSYEQRELNRIEDDPGAKRGRYWTSEEHSRFLTALDKCGERAGGARPWRRGPPPQGLRRLSLPQVWREEC